MFSDFTPHGDTLSVMGILGLNPVDSPEDEDVYTETIFKLIDDLLTEDFQRDFQRGMKSSLGDEMSWLLDQGGHPDPPQGQGFKLDRPKDKNSNAFVAKEEEEKEEEIIGEE